LTGKRLGLWAAHCIRNPIGSSAILHRADTRQSTIERFTLTLGFRLIRT